MAPLSIPILNEQNLSEDEDEDHPTWLRNELEGAPDIRMLTIQKDGSAEGLKRECTLITTRRLKKSKMSRKSNIPKPTRSVSGPKSKQPYFQARQGSGKKSQTNQKANEEMKLLVTSLQVISYPESHFQTIFLAGKRWSSGTSGKAGRGAKARERADRAGVRKTASGEREASERFSISSNL